MNRCGRRCRAIKAVTVFPAGAGMNRFAMIPTGIAGLVFPAGAGMNRSRTVVRLVEARQVFPAGAGMNR